MGLFEIKRFCGRQCEMRNEGKWHEENGKGGENYVEMDVVWVPCDIEGWEMDCRIYELFGSCEPGWDGKCGRLRWYGHVERKDMSEWVSAWKELQVEATNGNDRKRKTWNECVIIDMKRLGVQGGCSESR